MGERGRPRQFDTTEALDQAMAVFWHSGFEATSMTALIEAMKINSPSIYAAFGSKEGLFRAALRHYQENYAAGLLDALEQAPDAATGLRAMFEAAIDLFTRPDRPRGCFVVLAVSGNAPPGAAMQEELAGLRSKRSDEIAARLRRDVEEGRLRRGLSIEPLADLYAAILQGIAVAARDGVERKRLHALYREALTLVGR